MLCPPRWACLRSCLPPCLPSGLGCCVRLLGSFPSPACLRSFVPSCFPAGLVCPCSGLVSKISCAICATVWGLRWCNFFSLSLSLCVSLCNGNFCSTFVGGKAAKLQQMPSDPHPFSIERIRSLGNSNSCEVGTAAFNQFDISKVAMWGAQDVQVKSLKCLHSK